MRKTVSVGLCVVAVASLLSAAGSVITGYANWKMNGASGHADFIVEGLVAAAMAVVFAAVLLVLGRWACKPAFARLFGIVLAVEAIVVVALDRVREWAPDDASRNAAYVLMQLDLQVYTLAVGVVFLVLGILLFALAGRKPDPAATPGPAMSV